MRHGGVCMVISCAHLSRILDTGMLSLQECYTIGDGRLTEENLRNGYGKQVQTVFFSKSGRICSQFVLTTLLVQCYKNIKLGNFPGPFPVSYHIFCQFQEATVDGFNQLTSSRLTKTPK